MANRHCKEAWRSRFISIPRCETNADSGRPLDKVNWGSRVAVLESGRPLDKVDWVAGVEELEFERPLDWMDCDAGVAVLEYGRSLDIEDWITLLALLSVALKVVPSPFESTKQRGITNNKAMSQNLLRKQSQTRNSRMQRTEKLSP